MHDVPQHAASLEPLPSLPVGQAPLPAALMDPDSITGAEPFNWATWQSNNTPIQPTQVNPVTINTDCLPDPDPDYPIHPGGAYHSLLPPTNDGSMSHFIGPASSHPGLPGMQGFTTHDQFISMHVGKCKNMTDFDGSQMWIHVDTSTDKHSGICELESKKCRNGADRSCRDAREGSSQTIEEGKNSLIIIYSL